MSILVDEEEPLVDVEDAPFEPRDVKVRCESVESEFDIHDFLGRSTSYRNFPSKKSLQAWGKFGEVKRCVEKGSGKEFAAKFICAPRPQDKSEVEQEVEIMKKLQHKRLLQLYDCFCSKTEMCLVLEIILGGELFDRVIDDDFILTERACVVFMRQICEGVEYMHSQNIIHLDMKPENILCLTRTGNRIKIIDFGLAREYNPKKDLRVLFGTPEFMAPEVVQYEPISFSTDMWSVGVICYVLLSGLSPFMGDNDGDTLVNVIKGEYDFNYAEFSDVTEPAKDLIRKLLVMDKTKRLTATECLQHPWLKREERRVSVSHLDLSKKRLKRFVYRRKWQKIVNAIIALKRMGVRIKELRKRRGFSGHIKKQESIFGWDAKKSSPAVRNGLKSPDVPDAGRVEETPETSSCDDQTGRDSAQGYSNTQAEISLKLATDASSAASRQTSTASVGATSQSSTQQEAAATLDLCVFGSETSIDGKAEPSSETDFTSGDVDVFCEFAISLPAAPTVEEVSATVELPVVTNQNKEKPRAEKIKASDRTSIEKSMDKYKSRKKDRDKDKEVAKEKEKVIDKDSSSKETSTPSHRDQDKAKDKAQEREKDKKKESLEKAEDKTKDIMKSKNKDKDRGKEKSKEKEKDKDKGKEREKNKEKSNETDIDKDKDKEKEKHKNGVDPPWSRRGRPEPGVLRHVPLQERHKPPPKRQEAPWSKRIRKQDGVHLHTLKDWRDVQSKTGKSKRPSDVPPDSPLATVQVTCADSPEKDSAGDTHLRVNTEKPVRKISDASAKEAPANMRVSKKSKPIEIENGRPKSENLENVTVVVDHVEGASAKESETVKTSAASDKKKWDIGHHKDTGAESSQAGKPKQESSSKEDSVSNRKLGVDDFDVGDKPRFDKQREYLASKSDTTIGGKKPGLKLDIKKAATAGKDKQSNALSATHVTDLPSVQSKGRFSQAKSPPCWWKTKPFVAEKQDPKKDNTPPDSKVSSPSCVQSDDKSTTDDRKHSHWKTRQFPPEQKEPKEDMNLNIKRVPKVISPSVMQQELDKDTQSENKTSGWKPKLITSEQQKHDQDKTTEKKHVPRVLSPSRMQEKKDAQEENKTSQSKTKQFGPQEDRTVDKAHDHRVRTTPNVLDNKKDIEAESKHKHWKPKPFTLQPANPTQETDDKSKANSKQEPMFPWRQNAFRKMSLPPEEKSHFNVFDARSKGSEKSKLLNKFTSEENLSTANYTNALIENSPWSRSHSIQDGDGYRSLPRKPFKRHPAVPDVFPKIQELPQTQQNNKQSATWQKSKSLMTEQPRKTAPSAAKTKKPVGSTEGHGVPAKTMTSAPAGSKASMDNTGLVSPTVCNPSSVHHGFATLPRKKPAAKPKVAVKTMSDELKSPIKDVNGSGKQLQEGENDDQGEVKIMSIRDRIRLLKTQKEEEKNAQPKVQFHYVPEEEEA